MDYIFSLFSVLIPDTGLMRVIFLIVVGTAVFSLALGVLFLLAALFNPLQSRLKKLTGEDRRKTSVLYNASKALKPLTQYVEPQQVKEQTRMMQKLAHAGYRSPNALSMFYALKMISMVVLPAVTLVMTMFNPNHTPAEVGYFMLIASAIGFMLPNIFLNRAVKSRQRILRKSNSWTLANPWRSRPRSWVRRTG